MFRKWSFNQVQHIIYNATADSLVAIQSGHNLQKSSSVINLDKTVLANNLLSLSILLVVLLIHLLIVYILFKR